MESARFRARRLALFACLLLACEAEPTGPLAPGAWGGTGISFDVAADSAVVELDCAHGVVRGAIRLETGRFRQPGVFVLEHGGPAREGEPEDVRDALYVGILDGRELVLTVQVESLAQEVGPFVLRRGATPILRKCL